MPIVCLAACYVFLLPFVSLAQSPPEGVYLLQGVMETGSGFKLNPDNSFEFFYSYGALDREGSGTWKAVGDSVIFNSRTWPGLDFKLLEQSAISSPDITLKLTDKNPVMFSFMYCFVHTKDTTLQFKFDSRGIIKFPGRKIEKLELAFEFVERVSSFRITDSSLNNYSFTVEPWLAEVFFKDFALKLTEDGFEGKHPALKDGPYVYSRQQ